MAAAPGPLDVRQIPVKFDKVEGLKCGNFCFWVFLAILFSSAFGEKETMTCGINHPKLLVWNVGIHDHRPIYEVSVLRPIPFVWEVSRRLPCLWFGRTLFESCVCGLVWQAFSLAKSVL